MQQDSNLQRFVDAQKPVYETALTEIKNGKKRSHWMWFIFPQVKGLGYSETSRYYGIASKEEAVAYLQHPVLGPRLLEISQELLKLSGQNANRVFGSPDDLKLSSSMTLFNAAAPGEPIFQQVLDKYFQGTKDPNTLQLLARS